MEKRNRLDAGISLAELIVVIMLLGIVGAMVTSLYVSTTNTMTQTRTLNSNTREASNGMNEVARVIRAATENPVQGQPLSDPAFVEATNEALTVYAYVNLTSSTQQPVKIRLSLDSSRRLVETQWSSYLISAGYYGYNTTPSTTRIMAGTLAPSATGPSVFTYLLANGTPVAVPAGGFTAEQFRNIAAVTVTLKLQGSASDARSAVTLTNTVGMPNLPIFRTDAG